MLVADLKNTDKGFDEISGELYTKGKNINLRLLSDIYPHLQVGLTSGFSDFDLWGEIKSFSKKSLSGRSLSRRASISVKSLSGSIKLYDLKFRDYNPSISGEKFGDEITSIESDILLRGTRDNWHLALTNSKVETDSKDWPGGKFELACEDCFSPNFSISTYMDYLNVGDVISTLQHFPLVRNQITRIMPQSKVDGILKNSSISALWNDYKLDKVNYILSLDEFNVSIPSQEIEVSSMSADLQGDHLQGSIELNSSGVDVTMNKIFTDELKNQNLQGTINWVNSDNNIITTLEDLVLSSDGINAQLQGAVHLIQGQPFVDIQVKVPHANLIRAKSYLPYKKMRPKLAKWLKEGSLYGDLHDGKLVMHGNPNQFPYKSHPGVFEATAGIENGGLNYRLEWPQVSKIYGNLHFKNKKFKILGQDGRILDSSISDVVAVIDDIKLPRLVLNGKSVGPASDVLLYLQESPLLPENSQIPEQISVSGEANLDLNVIISLTKKIEKERSVSGVLGFNNSNITVNSLSLPFTELNGELKFNKDGAEGDELRGKLFDQEFTGSAKKLGKGRTQIDITGEFNIDAYLAENYPQMNKIANGTAIIDARINMPRFGKHKEDKTLKISVNSDLLDTEIQLPLPLKKEIDEARNINISASYLKDANNLFEVNYADEVFLHAEVGKLIDKNVLMEIRFGDNQFSPPEQGIKISGEFSELDISEWGEMLNAESKNTPLSLNEIDIKSTKLKGYGVEFRDVDLQLIKRKDNWSGDINSSIAKGSFTYPVRDADKNTALGNFEYLKFNKSKDSKIPSIDPRILPSMNLKTQQLKVNDYEFQDVVLNSEANHKGMKISMQGKGDDLNVKVHGHWEVEHDSAHNTNLNIQLETENLHNSISGLGFDTYANKGKGSISGNLIWPATPYQFSVESFYGNADIRLKDGEISSVKTGPGKLIGLVNLGEISKRLSLDFTDFFAKGFAFEKIRGNLKFEKSNLTTENLKIEGTSADIRIAGRTGLIAKDYDQIITVTPHVSGGLPWVGLAVGGPLGAVGVLVGEKVAKTIGIDVNKVTQVNYSMTGSWENPKIERIVKEVAETNPTFSNNKATQGQLSPDNVKQTQSSNVTTPLTN